MLFMTLNRGSEVGDMLRRTLRQFCLTVYIIVTIPLISLGVLDHCRQDFYDFAPM